MGASADEELAFATARASEATPGFAEEAEAEAEVDPDPDAITGAEAEADAAALPVAEAG